MNKHKNNIVCKECGFKNEIDSHICDECGAELHSENSESKKLKILVIGIVSVAVVILLVIGAIFGNKQFKISKSNDNFLLAKEYEEKSEYESAIDCYSSVIPEDVNNYSAAIEKIEEINQKIKCLRNCAKAVVAAGDMSTFSESKIINIYYADKGSAYASTYGEGTVAIIAPFMSTNCTFSVVPKTNYLLELSKFPCLYNNEFSVYIYGIGTENYTQGWLKQGYDNVTDSYITMAKQRGVSADKEKVMSYVEEYYSTKDKTVFEWGE